jgi:site-specific recombinase XerC
VFRTLPKGTTLKDAKLERANAVSRLGRGERERRAPSRFGGYANDVVAALDCAPRTREKHDYQLRVHLDVFKNARMSDIDVDRVAALVSKMKKKKYAGATISSTLCTLSVVMDKAVRAGYAPANPVRQLSKEARPKIRTSEKRALDQEEIVRLLKRRVTPSGR